MNFKSLIILFRRIKVQRYANGDLLIKEGSSNNNVYFVRKGLVRSYVNDEQGNEITFQLYPESSVLTNVHFILFKQSSRFNYEAIEDTKVYEIDYDSFVEVASKSSELLELNRTYFGKRIIQGAFQRIESFVFLSPEERYKKYLNDYPSLVNRVPDKYIANILGITPVSLSRIRKRIANRKK